MAFSSSFSSAFTKDAPVYITPMRAQEALFAGAGWEFVGGRLLIDGRVLIGLSGAPYGFRSAQTAATWCQAGRRVIEAERETVLRLTVAVKDAWIERKREKLLARAEAVIMRAVKQADPAKRAALVEESTWCAEKWANE